MMNIGQYAFLSCFNLAEVYCKSKTPPTIDDYTFANVDTYIPVYVPAGSVAAYKAAAYWNEFTNIQPIPSNDIASGTCGDNLTWRLTEEYELVIEGTGDMYDYEQDSAPWYEYCHMINKVALPDGMLSIGNWAFGDCSSLTSITIPESVTSIGEHAFSDCSGLTALTIPEGVTSIEGWAFLHCTSLTSITIPANVINIGYGVLMGCNGLVSVIVEVGNPVYDSRYNCNAIIETSSNTLVDGCSITVIPNDITSIGNRAFCYCDFATISIPESVTKIEDCAFGCSSLTSITIPEGVTSIGSEAFYRCGSLASITIPESVTSIGESAFYNCRSLTAINIPEGVTSIGDYAFRSCSSLTSITCKALTPPAISSSTFSGVDKSIPVYVPVGSVEAYKAANYWKEFTNIQSLGNEYTLTVSATGYASLYLDYATEIPDDVKVYIATSVEGDRLMMTQVTGVLPAETGVIVRAKAGTYTFVESEDTPASVEGNLLTGTATDTYITAESGYAYYVLDKPEGKEVGMYKAKLTDGQFLNNANRAYLALDLGNLGIFDDEVDTEEEGGQLSNGLRFHFGGTTAIDNVEFTNDNFENVIYDLQGRRVEKPTKPGIYIVNGQKVMVR